MIRSAVVRWTCAVGFGFLFLQACASSKAPYTPYSRPNEVGRIARNRYVTPTGQILTPAGRQVELPGMRPQALALSPDGKLLVTAGKSNVLVVIDPASGRILQSVSLSTNRAEAKAEAKAQPKADATGPISEEPGLSTDASSNTSTNGANTKTNKTSSSSAQLSLTGLTFSPDGKRIYLANPGGKTSDIRAFQVDSKGHVGIPVAWGLPDGNAPKQRHELPTGLAVSADSKRLYMVGNLGNRVRELDAHTGKLIRSWKTGMAPFDIALAGQKIYVCNLGGRRPDTNSVTAPAGKGTTVRVDPVRYIPNEGSVTVIDLAIGTNTAEIMVELHPSAMAVSPNKRYVVVANTGSDTLSVIDTKTDTVAEKIWTRQTPADLFGAQPNALVFDDTGKRLFVCNGTQNAVAVIQFEPEDRASKVLGLIPAGWFPGAVQYDAAHKILCIANIKGIGALRAFKPDDKVKLATKDYYGTVSMVPMPSTKELAALTEIALQNMRYPKMAENLQPARPGQPARPVPERIGEPSVFKHVIYIIKENRTYDQVLGDIPEGNGHSNLCTFGEKYTPNQHKMVREFVLLDNTYCSGIQSGDGHQWTDSSIANNYVERQLTAGWPRSYPGGKVEDGIDAFSWASSGFIWDNALAHGKSFRNYGEWMISEANWKDKKAHKDKKGKEQKPTWMDFLDDFRYQSNQIRVSSRPGIETLRKVSPTNTVGWDLNVPDILRAAYFIKELKDFEAKGAMPDMMLIFLPNDHTGGTRGKSPSPGSQVADNDLAFGHIVQAVSHSKFWADTCIFAIEDDPQMGWDHVSGYRTTCYVISPYTKRKKVISTQYNQTSLMRTMELILGLPPMNQLDASATAMSDCFMETADFTPFTAVTNSYQLDRLNLEPKKIADAQLRQDALVSESLPLDQPDQCPEDVLNRILWRAMKGTNEPYPEWAVSGVDND